MKIKRRAITMLLTLIAVLMLVPAAVFADEEAKPVSISFNVAETPRYYEGTDDDYVDLYQPGNSITINYDGAPSKTYEYVRYNEDENGYNDGWFINGNIESDSIWFDWKLVDDGKGGKVVRISYEPGWYYDKTTDDYIELPALTCDVAAEPYPYPVSLTYSGADLTYRVGDWDLEGFRTEGNKITVNYSDGKTKKVFICKEYTDEDNVITKAYFLDGKVVKNDQGYYDTTYFDFEIPENGIKADTKTVKIKYSEYYYDDEKVAEGNLNVKEAPKPVSAVFKGKAGTVYIGQKDIYIEDFNKKGNKIIIKYSDDSTKTYKFITYKEGKYTYYGYHLDGKKTNENIWGSAYIKKGLKKGKNVITFRLSVGDYDNIKMKVTATASKLYATAAFKTYAYTGKTITPKIVVKDGKGKKISAKAYTVKYYNPKTKKYSLRKPPSKNIGYYEYRVTFKKAYAKKYIKEIWGYYGVVPKTPVISSVTAGKGSATVKWKKFSKVNQKNISGFFVEYSTSKKFNKDIYQTDYIKKTSGQVKIKGLEKGKKYYFRVYTYKSTKQDWVTSRPSKVKGPVTIK